MTEPRHGEERTKGMEDSGEDTKTRKIPAASVTYSEEVAPSTIQSMRERNSLVAINRLPIELLITIFQASLETSSDRFQGLKAIASVAWMWFNIVKGSPGLWAVLDSRTPAERLPLFIKRAGDLPVTIMMHHPALDPNYYLREHRAELERNDRAFLDVVLPTLDRWREASLILPSGQGDYAEKLGMLERPAPLLKEFHLESEVVWSGSQIDLFQGHAPDLLEMTTQGCPIRWSSSIFHNLLYVGIRGVRTGGPTAEEVLQSMLSSPRLRYFRLSGSALSPSTTRQDIVPIEIPHLTLLNLSDIPSPSAQFILSRIRAPALRILIVRPERGDATDRDHVATFFSASLLHFSPTIRSSLAHASGLDITIWADMGTIYFSTIKDPDSEEGISIHFHHEPVLEGFQACLELLLRDVPSCPPISLVIHDLNDVPESDLLWIFDSGINDKVTEADIVGSEGESLFSFICKGRALGGVVKWPLPKLQTLYLGGGDAVSGEKLTRLLRQRYAPDLGDVTGAQTSDPQSPLISEAPDRLTLLDVDDATFSSADYDTLDAILGPDVVQRRAQEDEHDLEDFESSFGSDVSST